MISTGIEFSLSGISLDSLSIPVPLSHGTNGKHIVLRTNYFRLLAESDRLIFRYEIKISPKIESNRRKTRRLIQLLVENYSGQFESADVATDYGTLFITSKQLPIDGDGITLLQRYYEVEDGGPRTKASGPYRLQRLLHKCALVDFTATLNINVANAAFYPAINLLDLMNELTPDTSSYAHSGLETLITRLKVSHKFYGKKTVKTAKGFSRPRRMTSMIILDWVMHTR